jgi:hypothetical protein
MLNWTLKTHDNGENTMAKKKNGARPKELLARDPNPAKIFSLTNQPPGRILQKCASTFGGEGGYSDPPVLNDTPLNILRRNTKVKAFLVREKGNFSALIKDLILYIIEHGGLIATNDPQRSYVLDKDRFHELSLVGKRGVASLTEYDRQERLHKILGIGNQPVPSEATPTDEVSESATPQNGAPMSLSQIAPDEIRAYVSLVSKDGLNGLLSIYPMMAEMPKLLGLLAVHSAKGREDDIDETLGDIIRLVHDLRDRIDTDALEILEDLQTDAPESASEITSQMIETQIRVLQEKKAPLDPMQARLSALKLVQDERLEHFEFTIIEQDLQARLDAASRSEATQGEVPILEAALDRAEEKAEELRDYIDYIADLLSPIKAEIDRINRRINALRLLKQIFQAKVFDEPSLRPAPEYDEDALLDWRTAVPAEPDPPDELPPPSGKTGPPAPPVNPGDLPKIQLTEQYLVAIFRMLGQRTSLRIANALLRLKLIEASERGFIFTAAQSLSDKKRPDRPLSYHGAFKGNATYRPRKHVPRELVDQMIPPEIQRAILGEFEMTEPKP